MLWAHDQRITISVLNQRPPADELTAADFSPALASAEVDRLISSTEIGQKLSRPRK
jgi:hypothetical protein